MEETRKEKGIVVMRALGIGDESNYKKLNENKKELSKIRQYCHEVKSKRSKELNQDNLDHIDNKDNASSEQLKNSSDLEKGNTSSSRPTPNKT